MDNRTSVPPDSIAEALFGSTRRRVLALLFGRPDSEFYLRQIVRLTGAGVGAVQRELSSLSGAGLVERTPRGNHVFFRANPSSPVFTELKRLVNKTTGMADVVRDALLSSATGGSIESAFVYGSVAVGDQTGTSDVDVMIIGPTKLSDLVPVLRTIQESVGREVNASVFTPNEFREKLRQKNHFAVRVVEQEKIMLIGTEGDLRRLVGEPLDS